MLKHLTLHFSPVFVGSVGLELVCVVLHTSHVTPGFVFQFAVEQLQNLCTFY